MFADETTHPPTAGEVQEFLDELTSDQNVKRTVRKVLRAVRNSADPRSKYVTHSDVQKFLSADPKPAARSRRGENGKEDEFYRKLKDRAAERGMPLWSYVTSLSRGAFEEDAEDPDEEFQLIMDAVRRSGFLGRDKLFKFLDPLGKDTRVSRRNIMKFLNATRRDNLSESLFETPQRRGRTPRPPMAPEAVRAFLRREYEQQPAGARKLYDTIRAKHREGAYLPGSEDQRIVADVLTRRDVARFVEQQELGQLYSRRRNRKFDLHPTILTHPFQQMGLDISDMQNYPSISEDPEAGSYDEFKYILVCVDMFSKFGYARALRSRQREEVETAIEDILSEIAEQLRGIPTFEQGEDKYFRGMVFHDPTVSHTLVVRADQEKTFTGSRNVMARKFGIRVVNSLPGKPWSNGQVEKLNGILKNQLFMQMQVRQKNERGASAGGRTWHDLLPGVVSQYNSAVHSVTRVTPASVVRAFQKKDVGAIRRVHERIVHAILRTRRKLQYRYWNRPLDVGTMVRVPLVMESERQKKEAVLYNQIYSKRLYKISRVERPKSRSGVMRVPYYYLREYLDENGAPVSACDSHGSDEEAACLADEGCAFDQEGPGGCRPLQPAVLGKDGVSSSEPGKRGKRFYRHELLVVKGVDPDSVIPFEESLQFWKISSMQAFTYSGSLPSSLRPDPNAYGIPAPPFARTLHSRIRQEYARVRGRLGRARTAEQVNAVFDGLPKPYRSLLIKYSGRRWTRAYPEPRTELYLSSKKALIAYERKENLVWICALDAAGHGVRVFAQKNKELRDRQERLVRDGGGHQSGVWFAREGQSSYADLQFGTLRNERAFTAAIVEYTEEYREKALAALEGEGEEELGEFNPFEVVRTLPLSMQPMSYRLRSIVRPVVLVRRKKKVLGFVVSWAPSHVWQQTVETGASLADIIGRTVVEEYKRRHAVSFDRQRREWSWIDPDTRGRQRDAIEEHPYEYHLNNSSSQFLRKMAIEKPVLIRATEARRGRRSNSARSGVVFGYKMKWTDEAGNVQRTAVTRTDLLEKRPGYDDDVADFERDHAVRWEEGRWRRQAGGRRQAMDTCPSAEECS